VAGFAVPELKLWELSNDKLHFDKQGTGSTSTPRIVTLIQRGEPRLPVTIQLGGDIGDFTVEGDHIEEDEQHVVSSVVRSSYTFLVTFTPTVEKKRTATLTITQVGGGGPQVVNLTGTGEKPVKKYKLSSAKLKFACQPARLSSVPLELTLTNKGNVPITIANIEVFGNEADKKAFKRMTDAGATVNVGESRYLSVIFEPAEPGEYEADLKITSDAGPDTTVSLKGSAVWAKLEPSVLDFGSWKVRPESPPQPLTLNNPSDVDLTITSIKLDSKAFKWTMADAHNPIVKARGHRLINVTFTPQGPESKKEEVVLNVSYRAGSALKTTDRVALKGISEI